MSRALSQIDDYKLLEAANKIKLVSDIGFKQLIHINYMRNHASAAHPNIEELTGRASFRRGISGRRPVSRVRADRRAQRW